MKQYKGIATDNYQKVINACHQAYTLQRAIAIIGEGGYGKTYALGKYETENTDAKVIYIDVALTGGTGKKLISALMNATGDYKAGVITNQLNEIAKRLTSEHLVILDEVSALKDNHIIILKDIMTALKDVCGIILSGTSHFWKKLNAGADNNRHLYSETRDRIFMCRHQLYPPTDSEAMAIFKANGLTDEMIALVNGKVPGFEYLLWKNKPTFRGIEDAINLVRKVTTIKKCTKKRMQVI